MRLLQQWGPQRGYFLEADKSIAVVPDAYRDRAELILREFNLTFLDGHRYVGGFIGANSIRDVWLAEKIQGWRDEEDERRLEMQKDAAKYGLDYNPRITEEQRESFNKPFDWTRD